MSCIEILQICIQSVELHLDLRASGELLLLTVQLSLCLIAPLGVKLSRDLVFIALDKFSDHGPNHMKLLAFSRWHGMTNIFKLDLSLLELFTNFIDNFGQVVANMSEQNPCQL